MTTNTFYISVGALGVFHTLRKEYLDPNGLVLADAHICNLPTDANQAVEKAIERVAELEKRFNKKMNLSTDIDEFTIKKSNYKHSMILINKINLVEKGLAPLGKYMGQKISELPESYILWTADQNPNIIDVLSEIPRKLFSDACVAICIERGLFEVRKDKNNESVFLGEIGSKINVVAEIKSINTYNNDIYGETTLYRLVVDGNNISYKGKINLGEVGEVVQLEAKVKAHNTNADTNFKTTVITRPKIIKK
jgi:hypothetical protein